MQGLVLDGWSLVVVSGCVLAVLWFSISTLVAPRLRSSTPLLDEQDRNEPILSLLLLGPASTGKSTIYHAALALSGEANAANPGEAVKPTLDLVQRLLSLPTATRRRQRCLLCDAGGGRKERRQWVYLVKDETAVGALVFVADVADDTEETLFVFKQLISAKWAPSAVLLALTHVDQLGEAQRRETCEARVRAYRGMSSRPFGVHCLDARDDVKVTRLLMDAASGIARVHRQTSQPNNLSML